MGSGPYKLERIFPSGAIYNLTKLSMGKETVGCEQTGNLPERCLAAFERHGYPALPEPAYNLLAPESVLSRYLFGWDKEAPPAKLWLVPRDDNNQQEGEMLVVAEGTFSVLLTTKAIRASLHDGVLTGNGRTKTWTRVYSFVIPLIDIDYLAGDKTITTIGCYEPETMFESVAVFPASDSWSAKIGWKLHHRTAEFNLAVANAVANAQATSKNPARAERAKQVLSGDVGSYATSAGGTLEFAPEKL